MRRQWTARLAFPIYERLSGRRPWTEYLRLRELQWQAPEALEARAFQKLQALLTHAQARVPYYRELFASAGLDPKRLQSRADLARLPTSGKADLRARFPAAVVASGLPARRRQAASTSGSTGQPFEFFADRAGADQALATFLLFREWAGADLGQTMLYVASPAHSAASMLRSSRITQLARRLLLGERLVHLSGIDLSATDFLARVGAIPPCQPYFVWGFPSYLGRLANQLDEAGAGLAVDPTVVICYAETLT